MPANNVYSEILDLWRNYAQEKTSVDQIKVELDIHKKLLNYFQIGDFYYYIFDLSTQQFEFVSPGIQRVLGYAPDEVTIPFLMSIFHPEDIVQFVNNEDEAMRFLKQLPKDKMLRYKVQGDYRLQRKDGEWIRILHQAVVIGQYPDGSPSHSLGIHTDITHLKRTGASVFSFIGLDGEPSFVDVQVNKPLIRFKGLLSEREREVLGLLAKGKTYRDISTQLFLSGDTIRTHVRNIYRKLNVRSKIEAINMALGSNNLSL